ncbi:hypothetical protein GDO78_014458 [Eleutherodactylus coqui]|uniref:Uncharacterized protein n=1 Tax=Eleutherodactylus coqui TaxID=57060 RepID=A0A8J6BCA1_ELECQ|nr:hypothetical protein GDO78_014458 [Eleutherodactylus coqui]
MIFGKNIDLMFQLYAKFTKKTIKEFSRSLMATDLVSPSMTIQLFVIRYSPWPTKWTGKENLVKAHGSVIGFTWKKNPQAVSPRSLAICAYHNVYNIVYTQV